MKKIIQIWRNKSLRNKILFTLFGLLVYRFAASITVPGVNPDDIAQIFNTFQSSTSTDATENFLGVFSAFSGGNIENFSIMLMGISPYINASIIIQLMTVVIPKLERLSKEGEAGRRVINRWTRYLTLPLALLQSYGMIILLNNTGQQVAGITLVTDVFDIWQVAPLMLSITVGTVFLMWLGEIMTERGIGNGISLIILAGIISSVVPIITGVTSLGDVNQEVFFPFLMISILTFLLIILVVFFTEGYRNIPITYPGNGNRGNIGSLPIRVNQAGMIPIIFAISLITFPSLIAQFFPGDNAFITWVNTHLAGGQPGPVYIASLFFLILAFTYFYISITFNPEDVAESIQKRGGFIPGVRPGRETADFLGKVSNRLSLWGGLFIAFVAAAPLLVQYIFLESNLPSVPLLISGSGIIIIVGVVLELSRQINTQLMQEDYDKYLEAETQF